VKIDFSDFNISFDSKKYLDIFEKGLGFESEIPIGFGLGSSGAFTASVFDSFFNKKEIPAPDKLKIIFSRIESFFHGKSSGIDPLIIYLDQAIYTDREGGIHPFSFDNSAFKKYSFQLIDSGKSRNTGEYVEIFRKKMEDNFYEKKYISRLRQINDDVICDLTEENQKIDLFSSFKEISRLQYQAFSEMIIEGIDEVWKNELVGDKHAIKLCGAGGGGFYYLLSKDLDEFKRKYPSLKLINIF